LFARFRQGKVEYLLGYHPLFEIAKCFYRVIEKPYFIGSLFRIFGYLGAFLRNEQQGIPDDVVKYLQREQLQRLKTLFKKM